MNNDIFLENIKEELDMLRKRKRKLKMKIKDLAISIKTYKKEYKNVASRYAGYIRILESKKRPNVVDLVLNDLIREEHKRKGLYLSSISTIINTNINTYNNYLESYSKIKNRITAIRKTNYIYLIERKNILASKLSDLKELYNSKMETIKAYKFRIKDIDRKISIITNSEQTEITRIALESLSTDKKFILNKLDSAKKEVKKLTAEIKRTKYYLSEVMGKLNKKDKETILNLLRKEVK